MKLIAAFDPGSANTAFVTWNGVVTAHGWPENDQLIRCIRTGVFSDVNLAAIEMIGHYGTGMPAGKDVFHTCLMIGRMVEAFTAKSIPVRLILRPTIKAHLCGSAKAKDQNVRQALIDRLGPPGTKKDPNPCTYGISSHKWAALAVAVYAADVSDTAKDVQFTSAL